MEEKKSIKSVSTRRKRKSVTPGLSVDKKSANNEIWIDWTVYEK